MIKNFFESLSYLFGSYKPPILLPGAMIVKPKIKPKLLMNADIEKICGKFSYTEKSGGYIEIEKSWVENNIVVVTLPLIGPIRCHKKAEEMLRKIFEEIKSTCPESVNIRDTKTIGGCWVPRHILFNPKRALSIHAFGVAFDINPSTNAYNTKGDLNPKIVEIFEHHGWYWGGNFSTRDDMHFQLGIFI